MLKGPGLFQFKHIKKINAFFKKIGGYVVTLRWIIIIVTLLLGSIGIIGLTKFKTEVTIDSLFIEGDPVIVDKQNFEAVFGNNDFVGVLVDTEDVFSYNTLMLIRELGHDLKENVPFAKALISLTDIKLYVSIGAALDISEMEIPEDPATLEKMRINFDKVNSIRNRLYSEDYTQAWLILRLKQYPDKNNWFEKIEPAMYVGKKVIEIVDKYKDRGFKLTPTGIPVIAYRKNLEVLQEMINIFILASIIALIFIIIVIRSIPGVIGTICVIGISIAIVFGGMGWFDAPADTTFMLVPMLLTIAVSIGYTIHILNFFKYHIRKTGKRKEAICFAFEETGWPILFTATTTIAALLSFLLVPIQPIRWVGLTSAISISIVYLFTMLFFSAILAVGKNKKPHPEYAKTGVGKSEKIFLALDTLTKQKSRIILIIFGVIVVFLIVGTTLVRVDFDTRRVMGTKLPHVRDTLYAGESKAGSLYSYDLMLKFKNKKDIINTQIFKKLDILLEEIASKSFIKRTSSISNIVKDFYMAKYDNNPDYHRIPDDIKTLRSILLLYKRMAKEDALTWMDTDYTTLRVFVEVSYFSARQFFDHRKMISKRLDELFPNEEYPDFQYSLVGVPFQFCIMNQYITWGQIVSFAFALIIITILMMIVFGSIKLGLIAMIPNVFPALVASGLMGFINVPLEFVTMTIAPIVLGLAVDDTIHFINHTKVAFAKSGSYEKAIKETFISVGKAITQAVIIICVTFFAFVTSNMNNIVNMGIYTIAAISAALLADLLVTPVLIRVVKPFGKEHHILPHA